MTASPPNASLRAIWRRGGKRKQSLQLRPWNLNSASNSTVAPRRLSCQIFVNRRECKLSYPMNSYALRTCAVGVSCHVLLQTWSKIYLSSLLSLYNFLVHYKLQIPGTLHKQTLKNTWKHAQRVMTSLLMSSPSISISHRLCQCRYSNSGDVAASSPSFSRPAAKAPRRVCSLANLFLFHF